MDALVRFLGSGYSGSKFLDKINKRFLLYRRISLRTNPHFEWFWWDFFRRTDIDGILIYFDDTPNVRFIRFLIYHKTIRHKNILIRWDVAIKTPQYSYILSTIHWSLLRMLMKTGVSWEREDFSRVLTLVIYGSKFLNSALKCPCPVRRSIIVVIWFLYRFNNSLYRFFAGVPKNSLQLECTIKSNS